MYACLGSVPEKQCDIAHYGEVVKHGEWLILERQDEKRSLFSVLLIRYLVFNV